MKIKTLHLKHFRGFEDLKVEFQDRFSIIAGINGKGKTSILEALALLVSRLLPQISPARGGQRSFSQSDIFRIGDIQASGVQIALTANCGGQPIKFSGRYDLESKRTDFDTLTHPLRHAIRKGYGDDDSRWGNSAPIAVYYTTDRAAFNKPRQLYSENMLGEALAYRRALVRKQIDFKDVISWYRLLFHRIESKPTNWTIKEQRTIVMVENVVREFLGEFERVWAEENPPRLMAAKGETHLDLEQLSDGERSLLAMAIDLCKRLDLVSVQGNPLENEGVVLIDELELHLHPSWQRRIAGVFQRVFPRIQFIATSHSPFIIQSLKPGQLINLDPQSLDAEYSDKSVEDIAEGVMGVFMPQKSERYVQMLETAEKYFRIVNAAKPQTAKAVEELRGELDRLAEPFSDDPAYMALLRLERETKLGGIGHAAH